MRSVMAGPRPAGDRSVRGSRPWFIEASGTSQGVRSASGTCKWRAATATQMAAWRSRSAISLGVALLGSVRVEVDRAAFAGTRRFLAVGIGRRRLPRDLAPALLWRWLGRQQPRHHRLASGRERFPVLDHALKRALAIGNRCRTDAEGVVLAQGLIVGGLRIGGHACAQDYSDRHHD